MNNIKKLRLSSTIKKILSSYCAINIKDLIIHEVSLAGNTTKIFYTSSVSSTSIGQLINRHLPTIKKYLAKRIRFKKFPSLIFKDDTSFQKEHLRFLNQLEDQH